MTSKPTSGLSAEFIDARVHLVPAELVFGYRRGYLEDRVLVQLAERMLARGDAKAPALEQLALLLSQDFDRVPDLVSELETTTHLTNTDSSRVWLFLVLAVIYERREAYEDPLREVEAIYSDFEYPEEMEGFVPFLPAPEGQASGRDAIDARWRAFLDERSVAYAERARTSRG